MRNSIDGFDERKYGCTSIVELLRAAQKDGVLRIERDLFEFPEFGFISREEREYLAKLVKLASAGGEANVKKYTEFMSMLNGRLGNRKGNGFFLSSD